MLGTGKSFRTAREADTVRNGCERAVVARASGAASGLGRPGCTIERSSRGTRKTLYGQRRRRSLRELPRTNARRHLRSGRLAAWRAGRPARAAPFSTSRSRRASRATITSSRAIAKRCSKKTRCCAARRTRRGAAGNVRPHAHRGGNADHAARDAARCASSRTSARARARALCSGAERLEVELRAERRRSRSPRASAIAARLRGAACTIAPRPNGCARARLPDRIATTCGLVARRPFAGGVRLARSAAHGGAGAEDCRIRGDARTRAGSAAAAARRRALRARRERARGVSGRSSANTSRPSSPRPTCRRTCRSGAHVARVADARSPRRRGVLKLGNALAGWKPAESRGRETRSRCSRPAGARSSAPRSPATRTRVESSAGRARRDDALERMEPSAELSCRTRFARRLRRGCRPPASSGCGLGSAGSRIGASAERSVHRGAGARARSERPGRRLDRRGAGALSRRR